MTKKKVRYAIDNKEAAAKHFAALTRLLREEHQSEQQLFKEKVSARNPEERAKGGRALLRLTLSEMRYNAAGQRLLSLRFANGRRLPRYALQVGDVVELSGRQTPKSARPIGTVYEKNPKTITVAMPRNLPGWVGRSPVYHLNLSENKTTYERMFEALKEVADAAHNQTALIRDIALGLRRPQFRDPVRPEDFAFLDSGLNEKQKKAVCLAFEIEDIMLIHGPPGTGKTFVLVEIIRQALARGESILVSAPSNAACDHLLQCLTAYDLPVTRLGNPARIDESLREHTFGYKMAAHPYAKMIAQNESRLDQMERQHERRQERREFSRDEKHERREEVRELRDEIRNLRAEIYQQVWQASDIVVATHTLCGDPALKMKEFDWIILDEATQAVEPATWIPLARAGTSGRVILAGDHYQLSPVVSSPKKGPGSLHFTLFERLNETLEERSKVRLDRQYRMHEQIMNFSSLQFYGGKLIADDSAANRSLAGLKDVKAADADEAPVIFLDTAGLGYEEETEAGSRSRLNKEEGALIQKEYDRLIKAGIEARDIAVISPYSAQVKWLSAILRCDEWDWEQGLGPEIDSIDAFQGREKEVVLVSLVRSNLTGDLGFLADTRRMNVAMTRAKRKLIIVGDSATISTLPFYAAFIEYVESVHGYRSAWEYVS